MSNKLIVGHLRNISGVLYYFDLGEGKDWVKVTFDKAHDTPINRKIAINATETSDGYTVDPIGKYYELIPEPLGSLDEKRKHIMLLMKVHPGSDASIKKQALEYVRPKGQELEDYYRYHSKGKWDVRVVADIMETDESPQLPMFGLSAMKRRTEELATEGLLPEGFTPNYWHALSDHKESGWCGHATLGGYAGVTYSGCGISTIIHELGHNFGMHHASSGYANQEPTEYGDDSCIMGSSHSVRGMNSPHILYLGFEELRDVIKVTNSQQVLLAPIELPTQALHETEYQHALIDLGDSTLYLSLRKRLVQYAVKTLEDYLYIHVIPKDESSGIGSSKTWLVDQILPGGEYRNGNIVVSYLQYKNETALLDVKIGSTTITNQLAIPENFPQRVQAAELSSDHNGVWVDAMFDNQGLDVYVKDGRFLVMWYTMAFGSVERKFYFGTGNLVDGVEEFDLHTSVNGTFENSTTATEVLVGRGQLYFFDNKSGVFNFNIKDAGRGCMNLKPVALSKNPKDGLWIPPATHLKQGFTVRLFEPQGVCTVFWYTYGSTRYGGGQRWFMCSGPLSGVGVHELTIYEATKSLGMQVSPKDLITVGTAKLNTTSSNEYTFEYDLNSLYSAIGKGTHKLTRLF